jgi:dihydroorotase
MTKMRLLGMSLSDVVERVTLGPARAIGLDEQGFGRLVPGKSTTLSVFREESGELTLEDAEGAARTASELIQPVGTLVNGSWFDAREPV